MADALSADAAGGADDGYPDTGSEQPPDLDSSGEEPSYVRFDVTVEQTVVEEKATGEEFVQWQATCGEHRVVSDSAMDAVMGVLTKANGGELP